MFLCNWILSETSITLEPIVGINTLIFSFAFWGFQENNNSSFAFKKEKEEKESGTITYNEVIKCLKKNTVKII